MKKTKTRQGIIKAFNAAIEGIIYTFKFERNMKIHYFLAVVVLTASLFLGLDRFEMILLVFAISLVVIAEMFNTAIEKTIDMITDECCGRWSFNSGFKFCSSRIFVIL